MEFNLLKINKRSGLSCRNYSFYGDPSSKIVLYRFAGHPPLRPLESSPIQFKNRFFKSESQSKRSNSEISDLSLRKKQKLLRKNRKIGPNLNLNADINFVGDSKNNQNHETNKRKIHRRSKKSIKTASPENFISMHGVKIRKNYDSDQKKMIKTNSEEIRSLGIKNIYECVHKKSKELLSRLKSQIFSEKNID